MRKSESIAKLAEALSKAQGEFKLAVKSEDNPIFSSKYAPLSTVLDAYRAPLSNNNLAVMQVPELMEIGGQVIPVITTVLAHSSGEYVMGEYPIRINNLVTKEGRVIDKQNDPQAWGSAVAYARRYSFEGVICAASKDDDGNISAGHDGKKGTQSSQKAGQKQETKQPEPELTQEELLDKNRKWAWAKYTEFANIYKIKKADAEVYFKDWIHTEYKVASTADIVDPKVWEEIATTRFSEMTKHILELLKKPTA